MSKRQDPAEQLLDLLVYAPLGLLVEAQELLPKLAEKGRQRMGGRVTVARMIGELAVRQGQRRAEKVFERFREQQGWTSGGAARPGARPGGANGHQAPSAATTPSSAASPSPPVAGAGTAAPEASSLAIPGYDTLAASQVVPRLEGLSTDELAAIQAYEEATRARKTILTRIAQLRGSA
jgi:hypothetical protein